MICVSAACRGVRHALVAGQGLLAGARSALCLRMLLCRVAWALLGLWKQACMSLSGSSEMEQLDRAVSPEYFCSDEDERCHVRRCHRV